MNIALFSDTYPPEINGVATSTRNLYRCMKEHGHNVVVVTTNPFSSEITYIDDIIRIPGPEMKNMYGYRSAPWFSPKVMNILRVFKPDICHIQSDAGVGQFGRTVARLLKCASVYTYHTMYEDYAYYVTKGHFDRVARNAVRWYAKWCIDRSTEFITPSIKTKDYMRQIGVDNYINVIPTGIDFSAFLYEKQDVNKLKEAKKNFGIKPDEKVILSLGRVAKEKSIDVCIKGYANFLKTKSAVQTKMLVVGGGPALPELESLAEELKIKDKVIFVGPVNPDEVAFYYHLGDIFVSASITETQGLTFMEAMAAKKILLCRYDNTLVDVIVDGKTGFFFNSENDFPEHLEAILALPKEKTDKIKTNALVIIDKFSINKFYENAIEVYKRAVRQKW